MSFLRECFDSVKDHSSDKWDSYFSVYDRHMPPWVGTFVEVGVQKGGSLDMWSIYFSGRWSLPDIIGIDVDPECAKLKYSDPKIKVIIGDQSDPAFWDKFLSENEKIDVFIDDGGHFMDQQILTFEKVFPKLSVGGVYFCEDTHTSYMSYNGGGLKSRSSFVEYAKQCADTINQRWWESIDTDLELIKNVTKDLTSVHFYDSMVVFEKMGAKEIKRVCPQAFTKEN